jgi:predicted phage terminase large subunit-like protein
VQNSKDLLKALLRQDLGAFIHKVFATLNPGGRFFSNWHIDLIAAYLSQILHEEGKRLIINIPPRSLKSICISVAWPAWILGHNPCKRIIVASYCEALSIKHSLDCRLIMMSDWYKELFPETIVSKKQDTKRKFLTSKNGFRLATSVGGYVTGEGADILIIDDPHNPTYVKSDVMRNQAIKWYRGTFVTRLNNPKKGSVVLVMQRLHKKDLAGYLSNQEHWKILKIPAIADKDYLYKVPEYKAVPDFLYCAEDLEYKFQKGSSLHESQCDLAYLETVKKEVGEDVFASQYQQDPKENTKGILLWQYILWYRCLPQDYDCILQSWDTAVKVGDKNDFSVCTTWMVFESKAYLIDVTRDKLNYPDLKNKILELQNRFTPNIVLIEDHASGQSVAQDLIRFGMLNIKTIKNRLDKVSRFALTMQMFQSGRVLFPENNPFVQDVVISELLNFPGGRHDDVVDSVSQALNYIKDMNFGQIQLRRL